MANRKAGSGDGGNTGAKRSAAGKKGTAAAAGDAAQAAQDNEATGANKRGGAKSATTAAGGDPAAAAQPAKTAKRAPAKGTAGAAGAGEGGGGQGAAKGAAKRTSKGATKSAGGGGGKPDLRKDLRQFITDNPQGWGHEQWEGLLSQLGERGHDTSNPAQIGMQLERERLSARLEGIEGLSQQRARSVAERFGTLYSLRNASVDEIAQETNLSREVAERVKSQLG